MKHINNLLAAAFVAVATVAAPLSVAAQPRGASGGHGSSSFSHSSGASHHSSSHSSFSGGSHSSYSGGSHSSYSRPSGSSHSSVSSSSSHSSYSRPSSSALTSRLLRYQAVPIQGSLPVLPSASMSNGPSTPQSWGRSRIRHCASAAGCSSPLKNCQSELSARVQFRPRHGPDADDPRRRRQMAVDEFGKGLGEDACNGSPERAPHTRPAAPLLPALRRPRYGQLHLAPQEPSNVLDSPDLTMIR